MSQYRIRSTDLFTRIDDNLNIQPKSIIFIAVEGNETEYDYFRNVDKFRAELGIDNLIRVEVIKRANNDTKISPESVFDLLCEMVDIHQNGLDASKLKELIPAGYDIEFIENYIICPDSLPEYEIEDFEGKMKAKGIDFAYFRFLSECNRDSDHFCIVIDKDSATHSIEQLLNVQADCSKHGYNCYITSPCFEFWLLLHLCNVNKEYADQIEELKSNKRVSGTHTYTSREVWSRAKHSKHISETAFRKYYLNSLKDAVDQAKEFETDISSLIANDELGSNLPHLFEKLLKIE